MRNLFRITTLLLIVALLTIVLVRNRKSVKFEVDNAKTVIDSIPVTVYHLKLDSARSLLETVGKVKSADEVYVVSQTPGEVKQVFVKIGQSVSKGEIIAQIDDYYARQEYEMAKKAEVQIQKDYQRYANLAGVDAVTQQQLEQLRLQLEGAQTKMNSLEKRLNDYIVKAPVGGVINQLFVSKGNSTGLGTPVCEILGGNAVRIEAKINPEQASWLYVGLRATMASEFGHGEEFRVQLAEIGERAGKFGGIAAIFTLAPEEARSPKSGAIVTLRMEIPGKPRLLIPRQALTGKNGEMGLFVVRSNNLAEFIPVKYMDFDDTRITILDDQLQNADVVVEGNYLLKTGDLVKVIK